MLSEKSQWTEKVNRKSYVLYHMVTFPMTLTNAQPGFQGHDIFEVEYRKDEVTIAQ